MSLLLFLQFRHHVSAEGNEYGVSCSMPQGFFCQLGVCFRNQSQSRKSKVWLIQTENAVATGTVVKMLVRTHLSLCCLYFDYISCP